MEAITYTPRMMLALTFLGLVSFCVVLLLLLTGIEALGNYFLPVSEDERSSAADDGCCACIESNKKAEEARKAENATKTQ
jgi:hypothetical protein